MKSELRDNKDVYTSAEFGQWADRSDLEPAERFLIERALDPNASTLEAGTGGGRLLLAMQQRGFRDLHGFDFVPELVEAARRRDRQGTIQFRVQDARQLDYADASFDQIVYLQQVLCLLPDEAGRKAAIAEAHRVLRPGGLGVFSFLSSRARRQSWTYRPLLWHLATLRRLRGDRRSMQELPWLRLNGGINFAALLDRGPYVYWCGEREAATLLEAAGFQVKQAASDAQIARGELLENVDQLESSEFRGRLYLVCRKPQAK